jgi:HEPN domain-containing protein
MPERHRDWLRQAQLDLDHARLGAREGHFEWAVFAAQQAAEKACKALHMALGGDAWGRPHHRRRGPSGHRRRGGHP